MQDDHLKYPNVLLKMSYGRLFFHLKKLLMLMNEIKLAINGHDTWRPLGI